MRLQDLFHESRIRIGLHAEDKPSVLRAMAQLLCVGEPPLQPEAVFEVLWERESIASTAIGSGVAFPHGRMPRLEALRGAVGIAPQGVPFDAIDQEPVHIVVAVLAPEQRPGDYLRVLARVVRRLREPRLRARLLQATHPRDVWRLLAVEDEGAQRPLASSR